MPKERPLQSKPLYLQAAETRAARLGLTTEELLERYAKRIKESKYPTRDCLTSDRVQHHVSGGALSDTEIKHVSECEDCRALLDEAARPSEEILEPLLKEVRRVAVKAAAHAAGSGHHLRSFDRSRTKLFRSADSGHATPNSPTDSQNPTKHARVSRNTKL
jgi:hypothetical protein